MSGVGGGEVKVEVEWWASYRVPVFNTAGMAHTSLIILHIYYLFVIYF
jgi:hypothetical protein